jgi:hypothetical protein
MTIRVAMALRKGLCCVLLSVLFMSGFTQPNLCACEIPRACCRGLVPQCKACEEGLSVEQWLARTCPDGANDAHYGGWDEETKKEIWICEDASREKIEINN